MKDVGCWHLVVNKLLLQDICRYSHIWYDRKYCIYLKINIKCCILTDFLQAREANICLTLEGLHMTPGQSLNMKISSSMSCGPKVQFLLVGKDINFTLWVTGAERFAVINKETAIILDLTLKKQTFFLEKKLRTYFDMLLCSAYMTKFKCSLLMECY